MNPHFMLPSDGDVLDFLDENDEKQDSVGLSEDEQEALLIKFCSHVLIATQIAVRSLGSSPEPTSRYFLPCQRRHTHS